MGKTDAAIARLTTALESQTNVQAGFITTFNTFAQLIRDAKNDPEEIDALTTGFEARTSEMAAALVAGTDAAEEPPPPPVEV